jgi:hypothetical protein
MTIDKFDPNPILVNINKLKIYRFVEDHTFQHVLAKHSDLISEGPVETIYFGNMFIEELTEINPYDNLFVEGLVKFHTRGLITINLIEKKTNCSLSNQELVEKYTNDLLKNVWEHTN